MSEGAPAIQIGDPVQLLPRLRPPAAVLRLLDGVVESIDDDRASVRWADGARSSARLQFLRVPFIDPGNKRSRATTLTRAADRADAVRAIARGLAVTPELLERPRTFNSGELHLRTDGHWPTDRPTMTPDELED